VARRETFAFSSLETSVEVYTAERLSLFDRMRIFPATYPHQHLGLWGGRPHLLTMCLLQATPPRQMWLQTVQTELAIGQALVGLSQLETPGFVARVLADEVEALTCIMHRLWQNIRETLWGEPWNFWRKL
jgi:urease accessory protein UreH